MNPRFKWAAATQRDHTRHFPGVKNLAQDQMLTMEGLRLGNPGENETLALVGDAGATLGVWGGTVLDIYRRARHQRVLAIVNGVREGVCQPKV